MRVCHVITRNHCYKLEMKDQKKKRDPWRIQGVLHSILDRYKIQKLIGEYAYGDKQIIYIVQYIILFFLRRSVIRSLFFLPNFDCDP